MMTTTNTVDCGKCDGKGKLGWTRNEGGKCFACGGTGKLEVTEEAIAEAKLPRAKCIAQIKRFLDAYAADGYSDDLYSLSFYILRADADVAARALAAVERIGGSAVLHNLKRQIEADRAMLGRRIKDVRKVGT